MTKAQENHLDGRGNCILTWGEVKLMRFLYANGSGLSTTTLAEIFETQPSNAWYVVNRWTWDY